VATKPLPATRDETDALAKKFFASLAQESDRGCVLVGAAFIDEGLEILLRSKMLSEGKDVKKCVDPLFVGLGPLRSFWAKTQLCRALDLLDEWMYDDLERIRNLRNLFAHSYENANFDDERVIALTEGLVSADKVVQAIEKLPKSDGTTQPMPQPGRGQESPRPLRASDKERKRFTLSASYLAGLIHGRAHAHMERQAK